MTPKCRYLALAWLLNSASHVRADWYYEASCNPYKDQLGNSVSQTFANAEAGQDAIGTEPEPEKVGKIWKFYDGESMDLTKRHFGTVAAMKNADKYYVVRNGIKYILENFRSKVAAAPDSNAPGMAAPENVDQLTDKDIIFSCDNKDNDEKCAGTTDGLATVARVSQVRPGGPTLINLCPWWIDTATNPTAWKTFQDYDDRQWGVSKRSRRSIGLQKRENQTQKAPMMDTLAATWTEMPLFHLMTKAVPPTDQTLPPNERRKKAENASPTGGNNWVDIHNLRNGDGYSNPASFSSFSMGARLLREQSVRIRPDGDLEKMDGYPGFPPVAEIEPSRWQYIDANWNGSRTDWNETESNNTVKRDISPPAFRPVDYHKFDRTAMRRADGAPPGIVAPAYELFINKAELAQHQCAVEALFPPKGQEPDERKYLQCFGVEPTDPGDDGPTEEVRRRRLPDQMRYIRAARLAD